jgi:hypothetical protein
MKLRNGEGGPMPDSRVDYGGDALTLPIWRRARVLEELAARQDRRLDGLFAELRAFRSEMVSELRAMRASHEADFRDLRSLQTSDFHWLLGLIVGTGLALHSPWLSLVALSAIAGGVSPALRQVHNPLATTRRYVLNRANHNGGNTCGLQ